MAKLIALDWDRVEARVVLARTQAGGVRVDQMAAIPLELEGQETNLEGLQAQLSKALGQLRLPKSQTMVAIGRSLIELRTMNLPPAPDEELPELVRFQAMREFSSLKDESPLDFLPLRGAGAEPGEVMAAAISVDLAKQVKGAVTEPGHELHRTVMRPCAAASLAMRRHPEAAAGITLVIAQQADSAELVVTREGTVVFTRSFRLPPDWHPGETGEPLLGEVRRTIAAAHNQLGGSRVERIVYFGTTAEHAPLRQRLEERTKLDVSLVDPTEGIAIAGSKPDQPERFAAILGMLEDEAAEVAPVIDFNHPRRKPVPESNRRLHTLVVATAVTVVLGLFSLIYMKYGQLEAELDARKATINQLSRENKDFQSTVRLKDELTTWKNSDHNWLDELVHLSTSDELAAEDFRLESLSARAREGFPGLIEITGRAKDLTAKQKLVDELSDEYHDVRPDLSTRSDDGDDRYPEAFTTTIRTSKSLAIEVPKPNASPNKTAAATDPPPGQASEQQPAANDEA